MPSFKIRLDFLTIELDNLVLLLWMNGGLINFGDMRDNYNAYARFTPCFVLLRILDGSLAFLR